MCAGGVRDGERGTPSRVSSAGDLPDVVGPAGDSADAVRLPAGLRPPPQGPHRSSVAAQLVRPDRQGELSLQIFLRVGRRSRTKQQLMSQFTFASEENLPPALPEASAPPAAHCKPAEAY